MHNPTLVPVAISRGQTGAKNEQTPNPIQDPR
jgi:hypothetical protein